MYNIKTRNVVMLFSILICSTIALRAQSSDSIAITKADTSNFSVDKNGGWEIYNSYVAAYNTDSARLELILKHAKNINWQQEQFVGDIKISALRPKKGQTLYFAIIFNCYQLRIDNQGGCFLRCLGAEPPISDPAIIPLRVAYKL